MAKVKQKNIYKLAKSCSPKTHVLEIYIVFKIVAQVVPVSIIKKWAVYM